MLFSCSGFKYVVCIPCVYCFVGCYLACFSCVHFLCHSFYIISWFMSVVFVLSCLSSPGPVKFPACVIAHSVLMFALMSHPLPLPASISTCLFSLHGQLVATSCLPALNHSWFWPSLARATSESLFCRYPVRSEPPAAPTFGSKPLFVVCPEQTATNRARAQNKANYDPSPSIVFILF